MLTIVAELAGFIVHMHGNPYTVRICVRIEANRLAGVLHLFNNLAGQQRRGIHRADGDNSGPLVDAIEFLGRGSCWPEKRVGFAGGPLPENGDSAIRVTPYEADICGTGRVQFFRNISARIGARLWREDVVSVRPDWQKRAFGREKCFGVEIGHGHSPTRGHETVDHRT